MKKIAAIMLAISVAALGLAIYDFVVDRAPPHRFEVTADRGIASAWLTLRDENSAMQISGETAFDERYVADASGEIAIRFKDGTTSRCVIGYITNGELEPHRISIVNGTCIVPDSSL